ncbi:hypothetical protein ACO22_04904 [Paracoccidioides brasiliensis]|uniref:Uncharacterized protein n=1 Tax=Paracoccidioides brasiliensis TaxID=121759 RepID=A0A1D2JBZ6_PARBR|nr:hypothetical protein ACO22_04904 [Paracoccidioides brasiliensis]ODH47900.1 hypothetical protein GX48_06020 [Paracoccidioides brasiliensis]
MSTVPLKKAPPDVQAVVPLVSIRSADLLAGGKPFLEFPRYSILDLQRTTGVCGGAGNFGYRNNNGSVDGRVNNTSSDLSNPFSDWLSERLHIGQPFVIQDFEKLPHWDKKLFSIESLIELSTKKNIPIRNCSTSRDLSFTLKKFADTARQSYREFKNLYARDLQCPEAWLEVCRRLLPPEVQWGGRVDLFQWLPSCARSEVMMAYVGSEGSSSGFHRCFSSTVALNLLVEASDLPVFCFGTDFESQVKYDAFMVAHGASPHVDWFNLSPDELRKADFPLYVHEQRVGELVVFPPATAHQVWNLGAISTKMVWNILHPLSLEAGLNYVQPPFNRLCHPDVARSNLSLACAMLSLLQDKPGALPPDLPLLAKLFSQMVRDEIIDDQPVTLIALVRIPETVIATCDFCGTAIWNRHLRCNECKDFDLCLLCFLSGRSCEHLSSYTWAEIVTPETCSRVIRRGEAILGYKVEDTTNIGRRKSLGTAVNDLMRARQSTAIKLCHLCRIEHLEWKGRRCDTCASFFCFRGLFRHFDMHSADIMRLPGLWACPKCLELCNCRCCHFPSAYVKSEKPASKRRVKPADPRGKIMGFTDNVFDQKRRTPAPSNSSIYVVPAKSQKRSLPVVPIAESTFRSVPSSQPGLPTPKSDRSCGGFQHKDRDIIITEPTNAECGLPPAKLPRSSDGSARVSRPARNDISTGKTLHGIDYITQMPSPHDDELSLPPLKSQRDTNCGRGIDSTTPSRIESSDGINPFAKVAAASRDKLPMAPLHELHPSRDIKNDLGDGTASPLTPTTPSSRTHSLTTSTSSSAMVYVHPIAPCTNPPGALPPPLALVPREPFNVSSTSSTKHHAQSQMSDLESRLHRLRQYADELLVLSLHDSHRLIQQDIRLLEETLRLSRKDRGERLLKDLELEFPNLVELREGIKREGGKMGLF